MMRTTLLNSKKIQFILNENNVIGTLQVFCIEYESIYCFTTTRGEVRLEVNS